MRFNSLQFLLFFIVGLAVYGILPKKIKHLWLLAISYYFYACWNVKYAGLMLLSTVITFICGGKIAQLNKADPDSTAKQRKAYLLFCLIANLAILFFFKYYGFFSENVHAFFSLLGVNVSLPVLNVLLPVGISFYTLQAIGYTIDVYQRKIEGENDFLRYALFVSFFPQLVAGPIERTANILPQLRNLEHLKYDNVIQGLLLMLWGLVQKVVIADRLSIYVEGAFANYSTISRGALIRGAVFFAFQVYCDFNAYSCIAIGAAKTMGVKLMDNFNRPYFAQSIADFWSRWHISLSKWLEDYVFTPFVWSRSNRSNAIYYGFVLVFFISGLWHGASWNFIIWGLLHGVYRIVGAMLKKPKRKWLKKMGISQKNPLLVVFNVAVTFILVDISYIFFRAQTISGAFGYIKSILVQNPEITKTVFDLGLTEMEFMLSWILIALLLLCELFTMYCKWFKTLIEKSTLARVALAFAGIMCLAIFGVYGSGTDVSAFIYFQF